MLLASGIIGCSGGADDTAIPAAAVAVSEGQRWTVRDTTIAATVEAAGVAEPIERATLSTKLMGSITAVLVREGDHVARGQLLARIDARDVTAKRAQIDAGISAAEAMYLDARTQAERFRALYADSAATRFQLDQAETGLARADAGLRTARASGAELDAVGAYAEVRAPFPGIVTRRYVDAGAFVAPGAPIVEVQNGAQLRISVTVPPQSSTSLRRGLPIEAIIEGRAARAIIEGAVPAPGAAVYTVNAVVDNADGVHLPGSAAILLIPAGVRHAVLIPASALVHEGDLTGVRVQLGAVTELRWIRTGALGTGPMMEVLSGLMSGDVILAGSH